MSCALHAPASRETVTRAGPGSAGTGQHREKTASREDSTARDKSCLTGSIGRECVNGGSRASKPRRRGWSRALVVGLHLRAFYGIDFRAWIDEARRPPGQGNARCITSIRIEAGNDRARPCNARIMPTRRVASQFAWSRWRCPIPHVTHRMLVRSSPGCRHPVTRRSVRGYGALVARGQADRIARPVARYRGFGARHARIHAAGGKLTSADHCFYKCTESRLRPLSARRGAGRVHETLVSACAVSVGSDVPLQRFQAGGVWIDREDDDRDVATRLVRARCELRDNLRELFRPSLVAARPRSENRIAAGTALKHFPAKRIPVRVKKMRQYKNVELLSDSIGSESALEQFPAKGKPRRAAKLRQDKNLEGFPIQSDRQAL
jgi:hypothetical protein